jgi:hydrogenase expression/formation protein HypE
VSFPACPIPITEYPHVLLAHGGGGRLMHRLVDEMFVGAFAAGGDHHDGFVFPATNQRLAFTTDSFVVSPLFFPGGDIGSLAVHGTVNDLAMCGATPVCLSAAFILEEGLPMETLWRVVHSMAEAARKVGVPIVTGDTKVVEHHKGDGVFITTTGVGRVPDGVDVAPRRICAGDAVLLSGDIGAHGVAVMSVREHLGFTTDLQSDSAPLGDMVSALVSALGNDVHVLRDPTRGGLAGVLCELAEAAHLGISVRESAIPVQPAVTSACELLGLDPLFVANEGKLVAIVSDARAEEALTALRRHPLGRDAARIGTVDAGTPGRVVLTNTLGGRRVVEMLSGEQLPRIC